MLQWGALPAWMFGVLSLGVSVFSLRTSRAARNRATEADDRAERATRAAELAVDQAARSAGAAERSAEAMEASEARADLDRRQLSERHEVRWASSWASSWGSDNRNHINWQVWNQGPDDAHDAYITVDFGGARLEEGPHYVAKGTYVEFDVDQLVRQFPHDVAISQKAEWKTQLGAARTEEFPANRYSYVPAAPVVKDLQSWQAGI